MQGEPWEARLWPWVGKLQHKGKHAREVRDDSDTGDDLYGDDTVEIPEVEEEG